MGVWVLGGRLDGDRWAAVFVDSVTMTAFGPVFEDAEEADDFLAFVTEDRGDPRGIPVDTLGSILVSWRAERDEREVGLSGQCPYMPTQHDLDAKVGK